MMLRFPVRNARLALVKTHSPDHSGSLCKASPCLCAEDRPGPTSQLPLFGDEVWRSSDCKGADCEHSHPLLTGPRPAIWSDSPERCYVGLASPPDGALEPSFHSLRRSMEMATTRSVLRH